MTVVAGSPEPMDRYVEFAIGRNINVLLFRAQGVEGIAVVSPLPLVSSIGQTEVQKELYTPTTRVSQPFRQRFVYCKCFPDCTPVLFSRRTGTKTN
jgi:hypothetical protein